MFFQTHRICSWHWWWFLSASHSFFPCSFIRLFSFIFFTTPVRLLRFYLSRSRELACYLRHCLSFQLLFLFSRVKYYSGLSVHVNYLKLPVITLFSEGSEYMWLCHANFDMLSNWLYGEQFYILSLFSSLGPHFLCALSYWL